MITGDHILYIYGKYMNCQKYVDMVVNVIKENGYVAG